MLSIILPTFNEAENLPVLLERIAGVLTGEKYEVIVVDDNSPDGTGEVAQNLSKQYSLQVISRIGRRGLSSAVVEGFNAASGDILMVMDADLQHDPQLIMQLKEKIEAGADIAVASRYMKGGSVGEWISGRRILSKTATFLAQKIPPVEVSDPMSGFFALRSNVYGAIQSNLRPTGFKILFEILSFLPRTAKAAEVPLVFQMRKHGESKLNMWVEVQFLFQILRIALCKFQWVIFWAASLLLALVLGLRAWALLPMYMNIETRTNVQHSLQMLAAEKGWLTSDVYILSVSHTEMNIEYRPHKRGKDDVSCLDTVSFHQPITSVCPGF